MNLLDNKLFTLLVVNDTLNFTKAAEILNLTQPAVSQHISSLEKEFDIKIFNHDGKTLILTASGEILVRYARRLKAIAKELENNLNIEKKGARILRIGLTHSIEGNMIPEVIALTASKMSRTTIKISSDSIKNLYDKLTSYEIDLAVIEGKVLSSKFSKIVLDSDSLVAIMSPLNPLSDKTFITVKDILNEKLILRSNKSATKTLFEKTLEQHDLSLEDFNVLMEIDNTSTIKALVEKNIGLSILPRSVCYNEVKNKTLVLKPIQDLALTTEINLIFNKNMIDDSIISNLTKAYEELNFLKK